MPRDYSKPPRDGDRPKRDGYKPGGFTRKPWEKRERPQGDDRGERGFSRPRSDDRGERGFRRPFGEKREFGAPSRGFGERRDFRPPRHDDELFAAKGKIADIVGPGAQSRFDMLRKLWDFFRSEDLIVPAGHQPRANADDWRHSEGERHRDDGEDRPPPKRTYRKPTGEHPTAQKARSLEDVPRRKYKETREG